MGGGRKEALLVLLLVTAAAAPPAFATDYTVGDSQGWASGVDYDTWVSGKTFKVGDTLVFQYTALHSVDEVGKSDYGACSSSNAIKSSTDGNTKVALTAAGSRYFICGTPGHCSSGMKLTVTVAASPSPTTPSGGSAPSTPAATPPSTPVPSAKSPPTASTTPPTTGTKNNGAGGRLGGGVALVVTGVLVLALGLLG